LGFFGGLRYFTGGGVFEVHALDDSDSDGLPHVTNGKPSEGREVGESFHAHRLGGDQSYNSSVSGFDGFWVLFGSLASTTVAFLLDLCELAGDVSSVAIQDRRVTVLDLTGVVEYDDLSAEVSSSLWWNVLGVSGDETSLEFFD